MSFRISTFIAALAALVAGPGCFAVDITWESSGDPAFSALLGGQAATPLSLKPIVLGQVDFTSLKSLRLGVSGPKSIASDGTRLAVADTGNNRVLIWNTLPSTLYTPADVVVGQNGFVSNASGLSATQLNGPTGVALSGGRLFVADRLNHRVLIWNSIPLTHGASADVVVGQLNKTSNSTTATDRGLSSPADVTTDGTRLIVADTAHHRVMIWNTIPVIDNEIASVVVGQSSFVSASSNHGSSPDLYGMNGPESVSSDGTQLVVADKVNNRVLIYAPIPTANYTQANYYLGQAGPTSVSAGSGSSGMSSPSGVLLASDGKLYVSDTGNHRVIFWNTVPVTSALGAQGVLGQTTLAGAGAAAAADRLNSPLRLGNAGGSIFVADTGNNRLMEWGSVSPSSMGSLAARVQGQPNFTSNFVNNPSTTAQTMNMPYGIAYDGTRLFVVERYNHRVLVWNSLPETSDTPADTVIGQADFFSAAPSVANNRLNTPSGVASDGTHLVVSDAVNNRVLIWNPIPTVPGTPAQVVIGQSTFATNTANSGGLSGASLSSPGAVAIVGGRLLVGDNNNNRVLIWNNIPAGPGVPADRVLGQLDLSSAGSGTAADKLGYPSGICSDGIRIFVTDYANNRVMGWNSFPTWDGAPADFMLGQPDLVSSGGNNPILGAGSLNSPQGCSVRGARLAVADSINNRVLIWNSLPSSSGAPADLVFGQANFTSSAVNGGAGALGGPQLGSFWSSFSPVLDDARLMAIDQANHRVLLLPLQ